MKVLKNSFGISVAFIPKVSRLTLVNKLTGSSFTRKVREIPEYLEPSDAEKLLAKPLKNCVKAESDYKLRSMSRRTKSKIRKKVIAFSRQNRKLSFVTLTFLNKVTDRQAIKVLGAFLDNVSQLSEDFQYLWVAEKQSKNEIFKENIHFHLITNKYWKIDRWWNYWLEVQKKQGIVARDETFKPSSAFDVKVIKSNNIKAVSTYITKYITKNTSEFRCMIWNCSRKISQLYTDFYSEQEFLIQLEKLEKAEQLGGKIKTYSQEYCDVHIIPLNNKTSSLYDKIDEENKIVWCSNSNRTTKIKS